MLHAVIMAGGSGTRFWPASRADLPKQLLALTTGRTLIQQAFDRLGNLVPAERLLIITSERLVEKIAEQLPGLPAGALIGEPCRRDTAPCIGLAALRVSRHDPDATMIVLPADHVIGPDAVFQDSMRLAASLVEEQADRILTFGIVPAWPAESFGYIERGDALPGRTNVFGVRRFREKPDQQTAASYMASGGFYWNSGIFVWKARTILGALAERQPEMLARLKAIEAAAGEADFAEVFRKEFAAIRAISIDYAVMEHATDVLVIEAPFTWDDVGSWQALARLRGVDGDGNTIDANHLGIETSGCVIRGGEDHLIATLGIRDLIVVHTPDATLVADKNDEASIRRLVQLIEEHGWAKYL